MQKGEHGFFHVAEHAKQAEPVFGYDAGAQLEGLLRFADAGKLRHNILNCRTLRRINMRHLVNQVLHKLEAIILLITSLVSCITG